MAKINKVYPPFFNGVSQQSNELILDNQCREMVNCVPSIVQGLTKRPPIKHVTSRDFATYPEMVDAHVFHTYDRGEGVEEYIFLNTTSDYDEPVQVYTKEGNKCIVNYDAASETQIKDYLYNNNLSALTVQDRTWIYSKNVPVGLDTSSTTAPDLNYDKVAYLWIKRGSGDRYNPYNYAVYLNGTTFQISPDKPAQDNYDPPTGAEDSDYAASLLQAQINANANFACDRIGSILKIYHVASGTSTPDNQDFTFSSWDSWGNQASEGWKGSVNKITDLPKDMPFADVYVAITGDENDKFTEYYVKWNGSSWVETVDPTENRGVLTNMPLKCNRTSFSGTTPVFEISVEDWATPIVGNSDNNPDPSFVGRTVQDLFFYKNRLGLASEDSIVLTESANYVNFYATSVLDIVSTDMVDVTISANQASKIYYAKPFNSSLYIFTKYSQYELTSEGAFSPSTVSLNNTTNYPMAVDVEPVVVNDSLYFISTTNNHQQLREYIKTDKLNVKGINLNVSTPTYLEKPIKKIIADGVLGYIILCTEDNDAYFYCYVDDGDQRVQAAWSKWRFLEGFEATSYEYFYLDSTLLIMTKTATEYRYDELVLDYDIPNNNVDETSDGTTTTEYPYSSSVVLPTYYPKVTDIRTPLNKIQLKKIVIEGKGSFDAEIFYQDYGWTYTKSHTSGLRDLNFHVPTRSDNIEITIKDSSSDDFVITSFVLEGLFKPTSKEMR